MIHVAPIQFGQIKYDDTNFRKELTAKEMAGFERQLAPLHQEINTRNINPRIASNPKRNNWEELTVVDVLDGLGYDVSLKLSEDKILIELQNKNEITPSRKIHARVALDEFINRPGALQKTLIILLNGLMSPFLDLKEVVERMLMEELKKSFSKAPEKIAV